MLLSVLNVQDLNEFVMKNVQDQMMMTKINVV